MEYRLIRLMGVTITKVPKLISRDTSPDWKGMFNGVAIKIIVEDEFCRS